MRYQMNFGRLATDGKERAAFKGAPFRIALLGDFSGRANAGKLESGDGLAKRKPIKIDVDNIDDILERFLPMRFGSLSVVDEYIHETEKGRYLVVHGDVFDAISQNTKWIAVLGDIGYRVLMALNRIYNKYRSWRGKEYFSISKLIKAKVKKAVNYISNFEQEVQLLAKRKNCIGIMCGHIHTPADKMIGKVHYLNSGDWVESATALVEHFDGRFEVLDYKEFCRRLEAKKKSLQVSSFSH